MRTVIIPVEDKLVEQLRSIIRAAEPLGGNVPPDAMVFIVDRTKGLKIEIRINEHPPPHFHVVCSGEDASFSIEDGTRLPGITGLERWDRYIRFWWSENRELLIERWNASRQSHCPVGLIRA